MSVGLPALWTAVEWQAIQDRDTDWLKEFSTMPVMNDWEDYQHERNGEYWKYTFNSNLDTYHFSPRVRAVVRLLVQGKSNKEIAYAMGIAENTVKNHLSKAYELTGTLDRIQLALLLVGIHTADKDF